MSTQRLYRSQTNKVIAGVCQGFAEYFDVDPVVIRILFVLMAFFGGTGIVLYIAAIVIVPKKPFLMPDAATAAPAAAPPVSSDRLRNWFGIALVGIGLLILMANLEVFHFFDFFSEAFDFIFPVLLIVVGMAIIYYRQTQQQYPFSAPAATTETPASGAAAEPFSGTQSFRQFRRSSADRKLFGVCGGLAAYFGIDSSLMRLMYVVLCIASFGAGLLLYVLIALLVPYDNIYTPRTS